VNSVFGSTYAEFYDYLYADKDYSAEVDTVERILGEHGSRRCRDILDLGCGTGNHAILLTDRGFNVCGVDKSESMIARARIKRDSMTSKSNIDFQCGDLRSLRLGKKFDAVLMMFAVLGYQHSNDDVLAALNAVRSHLLPGGLFVFDVWFGPAVVCKRPERRQKVITIPNGEVMRQADAELDIMSHICTVTYDISGEKQGKNIKPTRERHEMRYFFPQELDLFMASCGMELKLIADWADLDREPSIESWNVIGVAVATPNS
jgi:SAM-dependent methyltransferase